MHHLAVAADVGLHDVRGGDVGQGFLQDVVGAGFGKQTVNVEGTQGFHAAHAGSL